MSPPPLDCFSENYAHARDRFLQACEQAALTVQSHVHPLKGRDGEPLAIDVARSGPDDAADLMIISSGCHGIEGFCGSAVQIDLLRDAAWRQRCERPGLAVLYVHALNPYGFSWERRVTHENVDLNRNFCDFSQPLPRNPDYAAIAHLLLPRRCPPTPLTTTALVWRMLVGGRKSLQAAITHGQHDDPTGLFFAGREPTWSHLRLREILREHGQRCRRIGWIDVHTGLGPWGVGERIFKGDADPASLQRARQWWGAGVTSTTEGSSSSAALGGTLDLAVMQECPQAQYNGLTLEYGTLPGRLVLHALRAEQWMQNHPQADDAHRRRVKRRLRAAFYVETDTWKFRVLEQAREVMTQTLAGLSTPLP